MKKRVSIAEKMRKGREKEDKAKTGYFKGTLPIPKYQLEQMKPDDKGILEIKGDILPYIVTSKTHPDRRFYDIMPGDIWWRRPFGIHRVKQGNFTVLIVCPKVTVGDPCPICDYREERREAKASKKEIKLYYPSRRELFIWNPKEDKDHEDKPHILDASTYVFGDMLKEESDSQDIVEFSLLDGGYSIECRFKKTVIGDDDKPIKFFKISRIDFAPRSYNYDEDLVETLPRLDDILEILPYKKIKALFFEEEEQDDEPAPDDPVTEPEPEKKEPPARVKKTAVPEQTQEEKPEPSIRKESESEGKPKPTKKAESGACPHGHVFRYEFDKHAECEN